MQTLEGTWEEIAAQGAGFAGRRVRLTVLPEGEEVPFYVRASPEERARDFREWAAGHDATIPPLSDEAISRDTIYGDRS